MQKGGEKMKNGKGNELNVKAFALAGAVLGFISAFFMPSMMTYGSGMMGFNGTGYAWMMGGGIGLGVWMALCLGIAAGLFAWVHNWFIEKLN